MSQDALRKRTGRNGRPTSGHVDAAPTWRAWAVPEWVAALMFLAVYLQPSLFGARFTAAMRSSALLQLLVWWAATWLATLLLTSADHDPAATRRRVLVAAAITLALVLAAGLSAAVALAPSLAMAALICGNLWNAAGAGRAALRTERTLGLAMLPCLVIAFLLTQAIKPYFDHTLRSPELLTAGLLFAQLALLRMMLTRPARAG